jgi:hypothetical protein
MCHPIACACLDMCQRTNASLNSAYKVSILHLRRDPNRVHEEWFSDVEAVRASLGIVDPPADSSQKSADTEVS